MSFDNFFSDYDVEGVEDEIRRAEEFFDKAGQAAETDDPEEYERLIHELEQYDDVVGYDVVIGGLTPPESTFQKDKEDIFDTAQEVANVVQMARDGMTIEEFSDTALPLYERIFRNIETNYEVGISEALAQSLDDIEHYLRGDTAGIGWGEGVEITELEFDEEAKLRMTFDDELEARDWIAELGLPSYFATMPLPGGGWGVVDVSDPERSHRKA